MTFGLWGGNPETLYKPAITRRQNPQLLPIARTVNIAKQSLGSSKLLPRIHLVLTNKFVMHLFEFMHPFHCLIKRTGEYPKWMFPILLVLLWWIRILSNDISPRWIKLFRFHILYPCCCCFVFFRSWRSQRGNVGKKAIGPYGHLHFKHLSEPWGNYVWAGLPQDKYIGYTWRLFSWAAARYNSECVFTPKPDIFLLQAVFNFL